MKSKLGHFSFQHDLIQKIKALTTIREGETRIGQTLTEDWKNPDVKYMIVGVSESIGARANFGRPGAEHTFDAFLNAFCCMQSNSRLSDQPIAIYGKVSCEAEFPGIDDGRNWVNELDDFLTDLITPIIKAGKIPILIGGGHNNAFPLIQSLYSVHGKTSVINLDAHADCRKLEGRHSGNSFSYAFEKTYLENYGVLGLHKAYNNVEMLEYLNRKNAEFSFFDDYSQGKSNLIKDTENYLNKIQQNSYLGIELDFDCIEYFPSSAMNPIGFTINEARNYLNICSNYPKIGYYHLTEAAVINPNDDRIVGRVLAQLVYDIVNK